MEDLRHISTLDGRTPALNRQMVPADGLVAEACRRVTSLADEKGVALEADLPGGMPVLQVDPDRFGQVLFTLLENAIRHTPAGGRVTVGGGHDSTHAWLTVADTGEGIAPEHLPHIFERFYRADPARTYRKGGGAGIGLAIVEAIVQAHGGVVEAASTPGEGSSFTVRLPLPDGMAQP